MLSRAAWGHVVSTDGRSASVCPSCKEQHSDWEVRLGEQKTTEAHGPVYHEGINP
jgi:hypothetical protein